MITKEEAIEIALQMVRKRPGLSKSCLKLMEKTKVEKVKEHAEKVNNSIDFYNKKYNDNVKKIKGKGKVDLWVVTLIFPGPGYKQKVIYFLEAETGRVVSITWTQGLWIREIYTKEK